MSNSSIVPSGISGGRPRATPALAKAMSMLLYSATIESTRACTAAASVTSTTAVATRPCSDSSPITLSSRSPFQSATTTVAPQSARIEANAYPSPEAPPVTSATCPRTSNRSSTTLIPASSCPPALSREWPASGGPLSLQDTIAVRLRNRNRRDQCGAVEDLLDVVRRSEQLESRRTRGQEVDRDQGAEGVDAARLDRGRPEEDRRVGREDQGAAGRRVDRSVGARVCDPRDAGDARREDEGPGPHAVHPHAGQPRHLARLPDHESLLPDGREAEHVPDDEEDGQPVIELQRDLQEAVVKDPVRQASRDDPDAVVAGNDVDDALHDRHDAERHDERIVVEVHDEEDVDQADHQRRADPRQAGDDHIRSVLHVEHGQGHRGQAQRGAK